MSIHIVRVRVRVRVNPNPNPNPNLPLLSSKLCYTRKISVRRNNPGCDENNDRNVYLIRDKRKKDKKGKQQTFRYDLNDVSHQCPKDHSYACGKPKSSLQHPVVQKPM
jgi:hypothetical protein